MSYYCEKCKQQREQGCFGPRCPGIPKHANTDALPTPDRTMWQYGKQIDHYTAEQLRAAVAAERERAHNSGFVEASRIHGAEIERLRAREKACETMDHAQKVALVRALQECCEALGLHDMASPAELVAAVRALRA